MPEMDEVPAIQLGIENVEGAESMDDDSDVGSVSDVSEIDDGGADERKGGELAAGAVVENDDANQDAAARLGLLEAGEASGDATDTDTESDIDVEQHQKLDVDGRSEFLEVFHPESMVRNFEEVRLQSIVKRNKDGHIVDDRHKTIPFLTRYELTRVLGMRAQQLDHGAQPLVSVPPDVLDGYTIAEAELAQKKIPFIIRRPLPGGESEFWRIEDLELLRSPAEMGLEQARTGIRTASTSSGSRS